MKIDHQADFSLTVQRSRFHARLVPVRTVEEMEAVIRRRRGEVRRANHHCWALRIADAEGRIVERSKDDGEVGHPGRVLLELLRQHDLDGGLVVSRIFGGVKLGVGGVARAFREAARGAIGEYERLGNKKQRGLDLGLRDED